MKMLKAFTKLGWWVEGHKKVITIHDVLFRILPHKLLSTPIVETQTKIPTVSKTKFLEDEIKPLYIL